MKKKFIKSSICTALAAAVVSAGTSFAPKLPESASAEDLVLKYEFEDGATSGGKIHSSGWKGNTQKDGSGEDFDLTN